LFVVALDSAALLSSMRVESVREGKLELTHVKGQDALSEWQGSTHRVGCFTGVKPCIQYSAPIRSIVSLKTLWLWLWWCPVLVWSRRGYSQCLSKSKRVASVHLVDRPLEHSALWATIEHLSR